MDIAEQLDVGRVAAVVFFTQSCAAVAIHCYALGDVRCNYDDGELGRFST